MSRNCLLSEYNDVLQLFATMPVTPLSSSTVGTTSVAMTHVSITAIPSVGLIITSPMSLPSSSKTAMLLYFRSFFLKSPDNSAIMTSLVSSSVSMFLY